MECGLLRYDLGPGIEAFTAGRGVVLPYEVTQAHQVHGYKTAFVDRPGMTREELEGYDALMTNLRGCAIGVRTADCIPVLMYDPVHSAVAAVHAGWRGTLVRIVQKTILQMQNKFGTKAKDIQAVIGPGICSGCFQVGEEIVTAFKDTGFSLDGIYSWNGGKINGDMSTGHHIDLAEANRRSLVEYGVILDNIQVSGICTYEDESLYSARREGGECGRNVTSIMLL